LPTRAAPVAIPTRKRGSEGSSATIASIARCISSAVRAAARAWRGCSIGAFQTATIASPANWMIVPPFAKITGTTALK